MGLLVSVVLFVKRAVVLVVAVAASGYIVGCPTRTEVTRCMQAVF